MRKKILSAVLSASMVLCGSYTSNLCVSVADAAASDSLVYFNNFESGIGEDCKIVGNGELKKLEDSHGSVFHNAAAGQTIRTNYLLLPSNILTDAVKVKNELTISLDVNVGTATDYFYTPLFSAYATENYENTWPMMVIQSRGLLQVNCAGWTDFAVEENVKGDNWESTEWLDDKEWHNVTVTYTKEGAVYYIDGKVVNEWKVKTGGLDGLLSEEGASTMPYICLGGNQAWDWQDVDAAYYLDNVAVYSSALSSDEVQDIVATNLNGGTSDADTPSSDVPSTDAPSTDAPAIDGAPSTDVPEEPIPEDPGVGNDVVDTVPAPDVEEPATEEPETKEPEEVEEEAAQPTLKKKLTVKVGKSKKLSVKNTTKKVTWSSSNKKIAKVNKSGKVTGVKAGKAVIKAKVGGKTLKCTVTVK